jgi:hypothetical protein
MLDPPTRMRRGEGTCNNNESFCIFEKKSELDALGVGGSRRPMMMNIIIPPIKNPTFVINAFIFKIENK